MAIGLVVRSKVDRHFTGADLRNTPPMGSRLLDTGTYWLARLACSRMPSNGLLADTGKNDQLLLFT